MLWAAACIAVALPWYLSGDGLTFFPFVLSLVGGWLCGHAIVSATFAMQPPRRGAIVHAVVALVLAAALYALVSFGPEVTGDLPEPTRRALFLVQMAAIPGVTWIWFGVIARLTGALPLPRRKQSPHRAPSANREARDPEWEFDADAAVLHFTAIPMRLRTVGLQIAAIVLVGGSGAAGVAILLHEFSVIAGPRFLIVVIAALIAFPAYVIYVVLLKRRTVPCAVRVSRDRLYLHWGERAVQVRLDEIESLSWRCDSEYARVVLVSPVRDVSLIVGLARAAQGVRPQLPALPPRVVEQLEEAGLERAGLVRARSRNGVETFRRAAAA